MGEDGFEAEPEDTGHEETDVVHGPLGHDLTYREIHAWVYGTTPALLAVSLLGIGFWPFVVLVGAGIALGFGTRREEVNVRDNVVIRAIYDEPAWFTFGVLSGTCGGAVLRILFVLAV